MSQQQPASTKQQRFQVFVIGPNDFLRTLAGNVRLFDTHEAALAAANEHGGFVQAEGSAPPGGFDHPV